MKLSHVAALLLFLAAVAASLDRGGVTPLALGGACASSALALFLGALSERRSGRSSRLPLAVLGPLAVLLFAGLQCVPMPTPLLAWLAPHSAEIRFLPPAPPSSWAPTSLDVPSTLTTLPFAFALACAMAAAALLARRAQLQLLLLAAPVAAALVQAVLIFLRFAAERRLEGTFVNRNHLAALLVLGALTAMGAVLSPPAPLDESPSGRALASRTPWIAASALCAAFALMTLSRGGALSLAAGALALLLLERSARSERPRSAAREAREPRLTRPLRRRLRLVLLLVPLLAGLGAALLLSAGPLAARLHDLSPDRLRTEVKLRSFVGALEVLGDHPLLGVGRGAWRLMAERHRSVPGDFAFVYVENEPLQLAVEEGLPAALLVLTLMTACWLWAAGRVRTGLGRGALAALLAVGLHNLVDFNLAFVGVGLPCAVVLGAVLADGREESADAAARWPRLMRLLGWHRLPRALLFAALPLGLACAALPTLLAPYSAERESARLAKRARDPQAPLEPLLAEVRESVGRHPADWLTSLVPAIALHARTPPRTREALAWAGRAQLLGPRAWRPHFVAGAILLRAGLAAQARIEARLALSDLGEVNYQEPLELAARASTTLDELLEASPDDRQQRANLVVHLRASRRPQLAAALAAWELALPDAARTPESDARLHLELAYLLRDAGDDAGLERAALALPVDSCERATLLAGARERLHRPVSEVEQPLLEARQRCAGTVQLQEQLVRGRLRRGDLAGAQALLDEPWLADARLPFVSDVHLWRAELLEARGDTAGALRERWLEALFAPDDAGRALDYAARLRASGNLSGAIEALRTLLGRAHGGTADALAAQLDQLERERELLRAGKVLPQ